MNHGWALMNRLAHLVHASGFVSCREEAEDKLPFLQQLLEAQGFKGPKQPLLTAR